MTFLECIKYINDLDIEIKMLEEAKRDCHDERDWQNLTRIIEYKKSKMQLYKDNLKLLPKIGEFVEVKDEEEKGKVIGIDALQEQ